MKLDELIVSHVGDTTLCPTLLKVFLQTPPQYRQWGVDRQLDAHTLTQLNATDLFEFYLRLYLSGRHKTLQAVLREARAFLIEDPDQAPAFMGYSLALTRQHLLALEWYELLPRWETARTRIVQVAPELDGQVSALLISALKPVDKC